MSMPPFMPKKMPMPPMDMPGDPMSGGEDPMAGIPEPPPPPPKPQEQVPPTAGISSLPMAFPNWLAGETNGDLMDPEPPLPPPQTFSQELLGMPGPPPEMEPGMGGLGGPDVGIGPQAMGGVLDPESDIMGQF